MKNLGEQVLEYLQSEPRFRERHKKDSGLANLLMRTYPILQTIDRAVVVALCQDYATMDRAWRKILHDQPELRGKDYDEKAALEEEAMMRLGYSTQPPIFDK